MLVKNTDRELVNGTVGCVIGFVDAGSFERGGPVAAVDESVVCLASTADRSALYPLVKFSLSNGRTRDVVVRPHLFGVCFPSGEVRASRLQVCISGTVFWLLVTVV